MRSPSLITFSSLIIPEPLNHAHSFAVHSAYFASFTRFARCAATERNNSFAMAFLYFLSLLHQIPPPHVWSHPPAMSSKIDWAIVKYLVSCVRSYASIHASAHHPSSS